MGTIVRVLGIAVVLAGAALGSAGPASADQTMQGKYTFNAPGLPPATWTIFPICVNVVGDLRVPLELPVACTLHITSATDSRTTHDLDSLNWGGDARLTGGQWNLVTNKVDGFLCPDGTTAPTVDTYAFDDATLTGTHTSLHNAVCGGPAGMTKTPFTLAFDTPLSIPVEQYPLVCEPAGLRHCR